MHACTLTCMLAQLSTASTQGAACVDCRIIGAPGGKGSRGAMTTAGCVVYTAPTSSHAEVDMLYSVIPWPLGPGPICSCQTRNELHNVLE